MDEAKMRDALIKLVLEADTYILDSPWPEEQAASVADLILAAGYKKQPHPEWEYGVTTKWGMHEHPRLAGAERYAKEVREEIEQGRASGDLAYHGRIMRRSKAAAGPWVPLGEGEQ